MRTGPSREVAAATRGGRGRDHGWVAAATMPGCLRADGRGRDLSRVPFGTGGVAAATYPGYLKGGDGRGRDHPLLKGRDGRGRDLIREAYGKPAYRGSPYRFIALYLFYLFFLCVKCFICYSSLT